jgi:hypothetical protein
VSVVWVWCWLLLFLVFQIRGDHFCWWRFSFQVLICLVNIINSRSWGVTWFPFIFTSERHFFLIVRCYWLDSLIVLSWGWFYIRRPFIWGNIILYYCRLNFWFTYYLRIVCAHCWIWVWFK